VYNVHNALANGYTVKHTVNRRGVNRCYTNCFGVCAAAVSKGCALLNPIRVHMCLRKPCTCITVLPRVRGVIANTSLRQTLDNTSSVQHGQAAKLIHHVSLTIIS
jgi:hypothetical protein